MQRVAAVLCDIDGVLRIWDSIAGIEREHGFEAGALFATAFRQDLLQPAITGQVDDAEWRSSVAAALAERHGSTVAAERLVEAWSEPAGRIDPEVRDLLTGARAHMPVALVSNATTRLESDLERLEVLSDVDVVVNSARVGHAKPSEQIYRAAAAAVGVRPERCLFVDDTPGHVHAAQTLGMSALHYTNATALRDRLDAVVS